MAKVRVPVGYVESSETTPGVWTDEVTERKLRGSLVRNSRQLLEGEKVNDDLSVQNSISVVADPYAREHFHAIRYVKWAGTYWRVTEVTVESPRLLLRLGGVYSGVTAPVANTP